MFRIARHVGSLRIVLIRNYLLSLLSYVLISAAQQLYQLVKLESFLRTSGLKSGVKTA